MGRTRVWWSSRNEENTHSPTNSTALVRDQVDDGVYAPAHVIAAGNAALKGSGGSGGGSGGYVAPTVTVANNGTSVVARCVDSVVNR